MTEEEPQSTYNSDKTYYFNSPYEKSAPPEKDAYYDKYFKEPKTHDGEPVVVSSYAQRKLKIDPKTVDVEASSIPLYVFYEIITLGVFGLYWRYKLNKNLSKLTGETKLMPGVLFVLVMSFTLGVYDFSWQYMMGENVDLLKYNELKDTGFKYVIRRLFLIHIFNYIDMQKTINSFAK